MSAYKNLLNLLSERQHLSFFQRLGSWDRECIMPSAAMPQRTSHMVYLSQKIHEFTCSNEFADALNAAEAENNKLSDVEQCNLRFIRRLFDNENAMTSEWVKQFAEQRGKNSSSWKKARAESDFSLFQKDLEKTIQLQRERAELLGYEDHIYDALHDKFEIGSKTADVQRLFATLAPATSDLLAEIKDIYPEPIAPPPGPYSEQGQINITDAILASIGFNTERGTLGTTVHPFCSRIDGDDTRLAICYVEDNALIYIGLLMHEAGHGIYNQGLPEKLLNQPAGDAISLGIHESQSRLFENYVGRSKAYCTWLLPFMQKQFPQYKDVDVDTFTKMRNSVHECRIRTASDEISYNLHIILRFEMELALISGELNVADLPAAWNKRFEELFGYAVRNDAEGCLQDVHWSMGAFGYFPTYTMGNCYAAQFFHYAKRNLPKLDEDMAKGDCSSLVKWLNKNIHQHGSRYMPNELCIKVTGEHLNPTYLLNSLRVRYLN